MKKIIYAAIAVIVIVIIGVIYSHDKLVPSVINIPDKINNQPSHTIETFATSTGLVNVEVNYPKFNPGIFNTEVTTRANRALERYVVDPAEKFFAMGVPEASKLKADFPDWPGHYEYTTDFEIGTTTEDYINIIFSNYIDTGGAHGTGVTDILVLDKVDGHIIGLDDVFVDATATSMILPGLVTESLISVKMTKLGISDESAAAGVESYLSTGLAGTPQNFGQFSIAPEGITFWFGTYQIGAYVEGEYQAFVPWAELQDYLSEDFKVMPN